MSRTPTEWRPLKRQTRTTYGCMAAGQSPWKQACCGLGSTSALSVTHSVAEVPYAACGAIQNEAHLCSHAGLRQAKYCRTYLLTLHLRSSSIPKHIFFHRYAVLRFQSLLATELQRSRRTTLSCIIIVMHRRSSTCHCAMRGNAISRKNLHVSSPYMTSS